MGMTMVMVVRTVIVSTKLVGIMIVDSSLRNHRIGLNRMGKIVVTAASIRPAMRGQRDVKESPSNERFQPMHTPVGHTICQPWTRQKTNQCRHGHGQGNSPTHRDWPSRTLSSNGNSKTHRQPMDDYRPRQKASVILHGQHRTIKQQMKRDSDRNQPQRSHPPPAEPMPHPRENQTDDSQDQPVKPNLCNHMRQHNEQTDARDHHQREPINQLTDRTGTLTQHRTQGAHKKRHRGRQQQHSRSHPKHSRR